eukprot:1144601-Pelagomonas_calceolata.AAC.1
MPRKCKEVPGEAKECQEMQGSARGCKGMRGSARKPLQSTKLSLLLSCTVSTVIAGPLGPQTLAATINAILIVLFWNPSVDMASSSLPSCVPHPDTCKALPHALKLLLCCLCCCIPAHTSGVNLIRWILSTGPSPSVWGLMKKPYEDKDLCPCLG